jgi:hypothetical protein
MLSKNIIYMAKLKQDKQCTYKRNNKTLSRNHCCREKTISVKYSECVSVYLVMHHVKRMQHVFFCGLFLWWRAPQQKLGRTAALRLIVPPCDEDEEKGDQFFLSFFQVM